MAQFKSLATIQTYLEQNLHQVLKGTAAIERILADAMSKTVVDVVYSKYSPKEYERRGLNDGLSDPRNGIVSDVIIESNGRVRLVFENIAEGSDTLMNSMLVDTIEEGIQENWSNPEGVWSNPRPFMEETANRIKQNPSEVINAIKSGLRGIGMKVR